MVDCGPVGPLRHTDDDLRRSARLAARIRLSGGYVTAPEPLSGIELIARRDRLAEVLNTEVRVHSIRHDGRAIFAVAPCSPAEPTALVEPTTGERFIAACEEAGVPVDVDAVHEFDDAWARWRALRSPEEEGSVDPTSVGAIVSGVTGLVVATGATVANRGRAQREEDAEHAALTRELERSVAEVRQAAARMAALSTPPAQVQRSGRGSVNVQSGGNVIVGGDLHVHGSHAARSEADVRADLDAAHARAEADARERRAPSPTASLARAREAEVAARRQIRRARATSVGAADIRRQVAWIGGGAVALLAVTAVFLGLPALVFVPVVAWLTIRAMNRQAAIRRDAVLLREDAEEDHGLALALLLALEAEHGGPGG